MKYTSFKNLMVCKLYKYLNPFYFNFNNGFNNLLKNLIKLDSYSFWPKHFNFLALKNYPLALYRTMWLLNIGLAPRNFFQMRPSVKFFQDRFGFSETETQSKVRNRIPAKRQIIHSTFVLNIYRVRFMGNTS